MNLLLPEGWGTLGTVGCGGDEAVDLGGDPPTEGMLRLVRSSSAVCSRFWLNLCRRADLLVPKGWGTLGTDGGGGDADADLDVERLPREQLRLLRLHSSARSRF